MLAMRTHRQIIEEAGGPAGIARAAKADRGRAKQWARNDSIPGPYWALIAAAGLASLEELAGAAAAKREPAASDQDAA